VSHAWFSNVIILGVLLNFGAKLKYRGVFKEWESRKSVLPIQNAWCFPLSCITLLVILVKPFNLCIYVCLTYCLLYVNCMKVSEARSLERDVVESGLTFAGFAVIYKPFCLYAIPMTFSCWISFCSKCLLVVTFQPCNS
jgi:hypothetical protein